MALKVGQLVASLQVDKGTYASDMAAAKRQAEDVGKAFDSSERTGSRALEGLASTAKRVLPALSIGAVLGAGWSRFTGIENADAKLEGLGHTAAETTAIMNDALKAVKGTAFGLDEAVNAAATATAAGVQSGMQLQKYLSLVADVAALTNSSFDDIARTMNRAVTLGGAYNDTLQILAERGLPIYTLIANQIGKTTAEVKKLASEGKISADVLEAALAGQVSGAAQKMGETTTGTLKNVGAAMSRVGADILDDLMPTIKTLANLVITVADGFNALPDPIKTAVVTLGAFVALSKTGLFTKMASGAGAFVDQLKLIKTEGVGASGVVAKLGKVGAIAVASLAVSGLTKAWRDYHDVLIDTDELIDQTNGKLVANARDQIAASLAPRIDEIHKAGLTIPQVVDAIIAGGDELNDVAHKIGNATGTVRGIIDDLGHAFSIGFWTSGTDRAAQEVENLGKSLDESRDKQEAAAKAADELASAQARVYGPTLAEADALLKARTEQEAYNKAMEGVPPVSYSAGAALNQWVRQQQYAAQVAREAAAAQDAANEAYNRATLGLVGAQQDAAIAIRDATDAAKKAGTTVVDSAGNFNLAQSSVRDMVSSLYDYRDAAQESVTAAYQQAKAQDGTVAAQQAAQQAALNARQGFIDMAQSMLGVTAPAAQLIANQLGLLQGIQIDDKTFTVTMVRRTVDATIANSDLGDSWMRRINQDAAAAAHQAAQGFQLPSLSELMGAMPALKEPKSSGASKAKKAADDAKRAAEEAARKEQQRLDALSSSVDAVLGQIGKVKQAAFSVADVGITTVTKQITAAQKSLQTAIDKGLDPRRVKPLAKELAADVTEAAKQLRALQAQITGPDAKAVKDATAGTVDQMHSAMQALIKDMKAAGASSSALSGLARIESQLATAMDQRTKITEKLADAQQALDSITGQYNQRLSSVKDQIASSLSIGSLITRDVDNSRLGMADMIEQLQKQADAVNIYSESIKKLKAAGLDANLWQQLVDAGPAAAEQAQTLAAASAADIKKVNELAKTVYGEAGQIGKLSADAMYGSGVTAAKAVVDGLVSQEKQIQKTIASLAGDAKVVSANAMKAQGISAIQGLIDGMKSMQTHVKKTAKDVGSVLVDAFKSALQIHSPSKVMADKIGVPMMDGVLAGMERQARGMQIPVDPMMRIPVAKPAVAGSGGPLDLVLTVNVRGDGPMGDAIAQSIAVEVGKVVGNAQVAVRKNGVLL